MSRDRHRHSVMMIAFADRLLQRRLGRRPTFPCKGTQELMVRQVVRRVPVSNNWSSKRSLPETQMEVLRCGMTIAIEERRVESIDIKET